MGGARVAFRKEDHTMGITADSDTESSVGSNIYPPDCQEIKLTQTSLEGSASKNTFLVPPNVAFPPVRPMSPKSSSTDSQPIYPSGEGRVMPVYTDEDVRRAFEEATVDMTPMEVAYAKDFLGYPSRNLKMLLWLDQPRETLKAILKEGSLLTQRKYQSQW